jgi:hypothetical protein
MLGRHAEARDHFEQAIATNRVLRMPLATAASERELSPDAVADRGSVTFHARRDAQTI